MIGNRSNAMAKANQFIGRAILLLGVLAGFGLSASQADEKAIWLLWKKHTETLGNHTELIDLCDRYERSFPGDPFLPVVRGIESWHLLASDRPGAAYTNLLTLLSSAREPLPQAGDRMAKAWLTRLDREQVRRALTGIYAQRVAFPDALSELKDLPLDQRPPLTDRWERPWIYKLTDFKHFPGIKKSRYRLESSALLGRTDLKLAVEIPYASRITLKPQKLVTSVGTVKAVMFDAGGTKGEKQVLTEGSDFQGQGFVHLGNTLILLSDGDHWKILPWPPVAGGKGP
jgi:hypothetical protein